MLCEYKDLFGKPNEGIHKLRDPIFGVGVWDVIITILGGVLISYFTKYSLVIVLICLFIVGIIVHRLFCVRSAIDKFLFSN